MAGNAPPTTYRASNPQPDREDRAAVAKAQAAAATRAASKTAAQRAAAQSKLSQTAAAREARHAAARAAAARIRADSRQNPWEKVKSLGPGALKGVEGIGNTAAGFAGVGPEARGYIRKLAAGEISGDQALRGISHAYTGPALPNTVERFAAGEKNPTRGHGLATAVEAAGILPFLKGPAGAVKGGLAATRAVRAGESAAEALRAGKTAYSETQPIVESVRAAKKALPTRNFSLEGLTTEVPAAQSRSGRLLEGLADTVRPVGSKVGLQKNEAERAGAEVGRVSRFRQEVDQVPALALTKALRKLDDPQQYALRIAAEKVHPTERAQAHIQLALDSNDEATKAYHGTHAAIIRDAAQYIEQAPDGDIHIASGAPKKLKDAWAALEKVSTHREDIYQRMGKLSDDSIANRLFAPGRVLKGARYQSTEQQIAQALTDSPERKAFHASIDAHSASPEAAAAQKTIADAQARRFAETQGDPTAVDKWYSFHSQEHDVQAIPAGDMLQQGEDPFSFPSPERPPTPDTALPPTSAIRRPGEPPLRQEQGIGPNPTAARGAYEGASEQALGRAIVHFAQSADDSTLIHEVAHFVRQNVLTPHEERQVANWAGATYDPDTQGYTWSREAEEKYAHAVEQFIRTGRGPKQVKGAVSTLSKELRDAYYMHDLPDLPPHVAETISRLFQFSKQRGGKLIGAEDFGPSTNLQPLYAPYEHGVPVAVSNPAKALASYVKNHTALFGGSRRAALGAGPADASLKQAYKGSLLLSGQFRVGMEASAKSLITASRLSAAHKVRKELLAASTDTPKTINDIAIKVDPTKDASPELKQFWGLVDAAEAQGSGLRPDDFEKVNWELVNEVTDAMFPRTVEGVPVAQAAFDAIQEGGKVDNIRWVDQDFLEQSGLLHVPMAAKGQQVGLNKQLRKLGKAGLVTVDTVNDLSKAMILYLNPAYIPVNLAGNLVMNFMQQGVFLPANMWRAAMMHRDLDPIERMAIDKYMGHGLVGSLSLKTSPGQIIQNSVGHWINLAVDMIPRRSAFLHEAGKMGYGVRTGELKALLKAADDGDEGALKQLYQIKTRANDAIVDYDRMTPLERNVLSRIIFFYPWLRGATRYTARFIVDHPMQAAGIAMAYEYANSNADEKLGERPSYAKLSFPISTDSVGLEIPGVGKVGLSDVVGSREWKDADGHPYVMNARQLFTQTSPLEIGQSAIGFATGDSGAADLVQNLTPFPYAAGVSLFGYDPYNGKEVPQSLETFAKQFGGNLSVMPKIQRANMSEAERKDKNENAVYPRSKGNAIANIFAGGLTPTPYNAEAGRKSAALDRGDTGTSAVIDFTKASEASGLGPPPPDVIDDLNWKNKLEDALTDGSPYTDKVKVAAKIFADKTGDKSVIRIADDSLTEEAAHALYLELRGYIYPRYSDWNAEVNARKAP